MEKLIDLIIEINSLHLLFNLEICKDLSSGINFSRKQVNHLIENHSLKNLFFSYLDEYYFRLRPFVISDRILSLDVDNRIKDRDSIVFKLNKYYLGKEKGKMPIQKCLNDILGFRYITKENLMESQDFKVICEKLKKEKIIYFYYIRRDGNYNAIHMYFKGKSNNFLPWELQIWYNEHEEGNRLSHAEHKQYYIK
ncbi:MAG: nucleotidyltransferase family protein [Facklamia hominis]